MLKWSKQGATVIDAETPSETTELQPFLAPQKQQSATGKHLLTILNVNETPKDAPKKGNN